MVFILVFYWKKRYNKNRWFVK